MNKISRRAFFKTTGLLGLASVAHASNTHVTPHWSKEYDVIVLGSGLTGIIVSIICAENNLKTLMVEKNSSIGGSTSIDSLNIAIANSSIQAKANIKDDTAVFIKDLNTAGEGLNHLEHTKNIAQLSAEAYDFLIQKGVTFEPKVIHEKGHSIARTLIPKHNPKKGVLQPLFEYLQSLKNFTLRLNCEGTSIIKNEHNAVIGITLKDTRNNTTQQCKSQHGLVYATGGFSRDKAFRSLHNPMVENVKSYTHKSSTADSLKELIKAGGIATHLSRLRYAFALPYSIAKYSCMINEKNVKRFANEDVSRQKLAENILQEAKKTHNKNPNALLIFDINGIKNFPNNSMFSQYRKKNQINKFESLAQLAHFHGLDFNKLTNELNTYNEYIQFGYDKDFNKDLTNPKIKQIVKAPFYTVNMQPLLNYTLGGILINKDAEVLDLQSNQAIGNLYAAGECVGGTHGSNRLISCSSTECIVYAMICAKKIVSKVS